MLTHCHIDHVGSAQKLRKLTNAKVAIHQEDADFVAGKKTLPTPKGIISILFIVIHTPGHTLGSISLYDPVRKVMFVGDAVRFAKGKINGPPERLTIEIDQVIKSIEKISRLGFDVMLSGHGDPLKPNASDRVKEFYTSLK